VPLPAAYASTQATAELAAPVALVAQSSAAVLSSLWAPEVQPAQVALVVLAARAVL
jgi:hypothetical protein